MIFIQKNSPQTKELQEKTDFVAFFDHSKIDYNHSLLGLIN